MTFTVYIVVVLISSLYDKDECTIYNVTSTHDMLKDLFFFLLKAWLGTLVVLAAIGTVGVTSFIFAMVFLLSIVGEYTDTPVAKYTTLRGASGSTKVAVVPVNGVIVGDESDIPDPLGYLSGMVTYGYDVADTLDTLAIDQDIQGVVVQINSPGGTIYGSRAIADAVNRFREQTDKPIITFVSGIGASGAYWVASSTEYIFADYGTNVGSIGVITGPFKFYDGVISEQGGLLGEGVTTEGGIATEYFSVGESKDLGNPYRPLTDAEREHLTDSLEREYSDFVGYVAEHRGIATDVLRNDIGAKVYDPRGALEVGLIDAAGNRDASLQYIADTLGVDIGDIHTVTTHTPASFLSSLLRGAFSSIPGLRVSTTGFCSRQMVLAIAGQVTICN